MAATVNLSVSWRAFKRVQSLSEIRKLPRSRRRDWEAVENQKQTNEVNMIFHTTPLSRIQGRLYADWSGGSQVLTPDTSSKSHWRGEELNLRLSLVEQTRLLYWEMGRVGVGGGITCVRPDALVQRGTLEPSTRIGTGSTIGTGKLWNGS